MNVETLTNLEERLKFGESLQGQSQFDADLEELRLDLRERILKEL